VRVRDDAPGPDDVVHVWIGGKHPLRLDATADGLREAPKGIDAGWMSLPDGYVLEGRVPLSQVGDAPGLAVRVDDVDARGEPAQRLWAGGHPTDGNRAPTPLEAVEVP
jgi:hypothetical protein